MRTTFLIVLLSLIVSNPTYGNSEGTHLGKQHASLEERVEVLEKQIKLLKAELIKLELILIYDKGGKYETSIYKILHEFDTKWKWMENEQNQD